MSLSLYSTLPTSHLTSTFVVLRCEGFNDGSLLDLEYLLDEIVKIRVLLALRVVLYAFNDIRNDCGRFRWLLGLYEVVLVVPFEFFFSLLLGLADRLLGCLLDRSLGLVSSSPKR